MREIALAADVGERTLFRYFRDKEELLFSDDDAILPRLRAAIAARPSSEAPATAVVEALCQLTPLWQGRQSEGRFRQGIIQASHALAARARSKQAL